ncbi:MAG: Ldh family oxidoreductase [Synergistaceae bacterium]|jgi:LDH2 family malate/lactate/ureidoglycolate dehydrogenase|nr:Ldh family oxidoreductase [Synergistaceae bacterium]
MLGYVSIPWDLIEKFVVDVFRGYGVPEEDSIICADVLLEADRRGIESHGLNRLKPIYLDRVRDGIQSPVTDFKIVREGPTTAVVDGNNGMGQVIGVRSMRIAIDKAKEYGLGMVAVRNSTHYGIAGYYCTMAAKNGCIGITGTNARPSVAPTFGVEGMLGTNPLTFGIPSDERFDFVFDCATSIVQRGEIETLARQGLPTPPGTIVTADGSQMTDSKEILAALLDGRAALAPLGGAGEDLAGYKGFGFATVVEILCAALQDGKFMKQLSGVGPDGGKSEYNLGHFFIAINVESFIQLETFRGITGNILRDLRNSKKAPGADRIYTAGEKEYLAWLDRKDAGVPVNESVQSELVAVRNELGLVQYRFPFE